MPTTDHNDEEKKYTTGSVTLNQEGRGKVNVIVMGVFKCIVGEESTNKAVGTFDLSKKNERGKMLINFYRQHDLIVVNTCIKKRKTKLYT